MDNKAALTLTSLAIGYNDGKRIYKVAEDINAMLSVGELVSLIGSNGAGKSTLLRTISAFQPPLSGEIVYDGCTEPKHSASHLSRLLAIVLTGREPIYNLNAREVVAMGRMPYTGFLGRNSDNDSKVVANAMEMLGILTLAERKVETLSDGERQKVMIAKALAQQTPIILLDEPTAFLDFKSRVQLMQTLRALAREAKKAILLSTHDLDLALQLSDKLWVMDEGRMYTGTVQQLSDSGVLSTFVNGEGLEYDSTEKRIVIK